MIGVWRAAAVTRVPSTASMRWAAASFQAVSGASGSVSAAVVLCVDDDDDVGGGGGGGAPDSN